MTELHDVLDRYVSEGEVTGAVALLTRADQVETAIAGTADAAGAVPMTRATIFRVASITKPVAAATAMLLIEDGRLGLDDSIASWLPELASPQVVRTPSSPLDDVVQAVRPVTVRHLLTSRSGWGFPADFSLLAIQPLFTELAQGPTPPKLTPDEWLTKLATIPMLHQPGDGWLYNTSYDILGTLVARAAAQPLPEFMAERVFEPLGMIDTGFSVPAVALERLAGCYAPGPDGTLREVAAAGSDPGDALFPSGAGGLFSTVDDWHAFGRMLLSHGEVTATGTPLLSPESVRLMLTNQLTEAERAAATIFIEGQGWGFGGSVDVEPIDEWNVPGRYGWVGGTGTAAHLNPATGLISILLTQTEMTGPTPPAVMRDFWRYAAGWNQA